ncbi:MAG: hypothetical protein ABW162_17455 [Candidatus Sedimenticola sp. PURPLELP]
MSYILAKQRDCDVVEAFQKYRKYLSENKGIFPAGGYELASSKWYFDFGDHKCPHDGWLKQIEVIENAEGERQQYRTVTIKITLLNAYHSGVITYVYPEVYSYSLGAAHVFQGHDDWRYDEFRINSKGHIVHEIEWAGYGASNTWVIEANDVVFSFNETKGT